MPLRFFWQSQIISRCLQVLFFSFPKSAQLSRYVYNGTFDFIKPSARSTLLCLHYFIKKMPLKNISSVITMVMFTYTFVLFFTTLVSKGPQKCSLVSQSSKHGQAHNPTLHSAPLGFIVCFSRKHMPSSSLKFQRPLSAILCQVLSVGQYLTLHLPCLVV